MDVFEYGAESGERCGGDGSDEDDGSVEDEGWLFCVNSGGGLRVDRGDC